MARRRIGAGGAVPLNKKGRARVAAIREWLANVHSDAQPKEAADWQTEDDSKDDVTDYLRGIEKRGMPNRKLNAWRYAAKPTTLCGGGKWIVRFLRLKDSEEEAAKFRKDNRGYFPAEFWKMMLPPDGELYPGILIGFDASKNRLASNRQSFPQRYFWQGYRDLLRAAWEHRFGDEYIPRLLNQPTVNPDPHAQDYIRETLAKLPPASVYPFQHDIMALMRAPWRARNCEWRECRQPFIPDKGFRRCCSTVCSAKAKRARQRRWWNSPSAKGQRTAKKRAAARLAP